MPSRFDKETKAKAVRLVKDHVGDYESEWAAVKGHCCVDGKQVGLTGVVP